VHDCCDRHWTFAHNGLVPDTVALEAANEARVCRPDGQTDSESAFCHLMSHVTGHYTAPNAEADWLEVLRWTPFEAGELRIYRAGAQVARMSTNPPQSRTGHGPIKVNHG